MKITSPVVGISFAGLVLAVGLALTAHGSDVRPLATFRTTDLQVDNDALVGGRANFTGNNAHIVTKGTGVSFAAGAGCGTGPACLSTTCNDISGTFTSGTIATACTITFNKTYNNADDATCIVQNLGAAAAATNVTTTATTLVLGVETAGGKYAYHCYGH